MARDHKRNWFYGLIRKENENKIKATADTMYSTADLAFGDELEELTNLFLNRNQTTIEKFRMMQKAAF